MKIAKIHTKSSPITRELIANCGEALYQTPEVASVLIKVFFKDGSTIGFKRNIEEDIVEGIMATAEEEAEEE